MHSTTMKYIVICVIVYYMYVHGCTQTVGLQYNHGCALMTTIYYVNQTVITCPIAMLWVEHHVKHVAIWACI